MFSYSFVEWLFIFYVYCFFGWCVESTYVSLKQKPIHFVNRGFMNGPFLPLYGFGATMMLIISAPFADNLFLTYLAGVVGATILEYVTGVMMEHIFQVRYWDYSNEPFNFRGHICLGSSLAWGFLTIFVTGFLHKFTEQFMYMIPERLLTIIVLLLTIVIFMDFITSFRAALEMKDMLMSMEQIRTEMNRLHRRLDVVVALANEDKEIMKEQTQLRLDELYEHLENHLAKYREHMKLYIKPENMERYEKTKQELQEGVEKLYVLKNKVGELKKRRPHMHRHIIEANPTIYSQKFKDSLEELKQEIHNYRNRKG